MDSRLKENDAVLFIDRKGRRYLKVLRPGKKLLIRGELRAEELFGVEEGSRIKFSTGETFLVIRPTYADLIPHLPRKAQVIYPKDTGPLIIWGDVFPGATVIEGGVGAGALTIALLRAVGSEGRVISYEIREDFAEATRRNVETFFGPAPNWTLKVRDLYGGFDETGVDRMFLDLPEPGRALDVAAAALRPGGVLVCYVPTTVQLKETAEAIQARPDFGEIESFETMLRHWQVKGLSVRPHFRMIAHSAFIIVSRRLVPAAAPEPVLLAESDEIDTLEPDHDEDE
ncbi:MAG TPA: tRNA (adenine-N1)-methyltransferase [Candidatus Binataceae bacterium]|nr:tRNA (adenine-N1)-methyltransferase [Candidatus Binataceae bacterium]